jgi:hypothetical protein
LFSPKERKGKGGKKKRERERTKVSGSCDPASYSPYKKEATKKGL